MIVSAEKVLAGSGMGPVGEDSAAPRQGANDPDAGWKGGRPKVHSGFIWVFTESLKTTSGSKDVGRYSSFCIIDGHLSSEKC